MMTEVSMRRCPHGDCQPARTAVMNDVVHDPVPDPTNDEPTDRSERDIERRQLPDWQED